MNAVELHTPDGRPSGLWMCGACHRTHDWNGAPAKMPNPLMSWAADAAVLGGHDDRCRERAESCCRPADCRVCGKSTGEEFRQLCAACTPPPVPYTGTDSTGRPVAADESPEAVIEVWEVSPHVGNTRFDSFIQRSWQEMTGYVEENLELWLERVAEDDPEKLKAEGVTLTFRLREMTRRAYDEIADAEA